MSLLNLVWLLINLLIIFLILVRSPNEQSLQEILVPLNLFESSESAEKGIDRIIQGLVSTYFLIGFILTSKSF